MSTNWTPQTSWVPDAGTTALLPERKTTWVISKNGREIGLTDDPEYVEQMVAAGYFATPV